jgi:LPS export ABC transporter protein LptC
MKHRFVATPFLLVYLLSFWLSSCTDEGVPSSSSEITIGENEPELVFKDISTLYSEDTKIIFRINADTQEKYQNGNERFPDGINIDMYTKEGIKKSTLVADSGFYSFEDKVYTVMGNVVVDNLQKNQKLESQKLNWSKETEEVYTDEKVKITDACQVTTGTGLRANQDFSEYEILETEGSVFLDDGC